MAQDKSGKEVGFGDWVAVFETNGKEGRIVRIVKLAETTKGTTATGAYVELVGNGRIAKVPVDVASGKLVMKSDGTVVTS